MRFVIEFISEIKSGDGDQQQTNAGKEKDHPNKKIAPGNVDVRKVFCDQHGIASKIPEGVSKVNQEACIAHIFETCNQPFEQHTIKRNVSHIQTNSGKCHPPKSGNISPDKKYSNNNRKNKPKNNDDMINE